MVPELTILICSSMILVITPILIMLNHVRVEAEQKSKVVDYLEYIRQKSQGDEVDKLIAQKLNIEDIAA